MQQNDWRHLFASCPKETKEVPPAYLRAFLIAQYPRRHPGHSLHQRQHTAPSVKYKSPSFICRWDATSPGSASPHCLCPQMMSHTSTPTVPQVKLFDRYSSNHLDPYRWSPAESSHHMCHGDVLPVALPINLFEHRRWHSLLKRCQVVSVEEASLGQYDGVEPRGQSEQWRRWQLDIVVVEYPFHQVCCHRKYRLAPVSGS